MVSRSQHLTQTAGRSECWAVHAGVLFFYLVQRATRAYGPMINAHYDQLCTKVANNKVRILYLLKQDEFLSTFLSLSALSAICLLCCDIERYVCTSGWSTYFHFVRGRVPDCAITRFHQLQNTCTLTSVVFQRALTQRINYFRLDI